MPTRLPLRDNLEDALTEVRNTFVLTQQGLVSLTVAELKSICREYNIARFSSKNKVELINMILERLAPEQIPAPTNNGNGFAAVNAVPA